LWGAVFGGFAAVSALTYVTAYPTSPARERLQAAFGANTAMSALFGPAHRLQTVAGFTAFKTEMTLMVLGAVWGILTATRLLRGEEDAGRWELLLAGRTTRAGATGWALLGLGAGVASLFAPCAAITVVTGLSDKVHISATSALFFALASSATAVMFTAVGALTSQLGATRRQAAGYGAGVLGLSYAVRLVADSGIGVGWLRWASPLGWVEELAPLASPRPWALVPIAAFTIAASVAAVGFAGARDLGSGIVGGRTSARPRLRLLFGPTGLAVRTLWPAIAAWVASIGVTGLLLGLVAKSAGRTIAGSSLGQVLSRLGVRGTASAAYLGVSFLIVAVLVAFLAAGQVTAARAEESAGRAELVVVGPVSRWRWLGGRCALAALAVGAGGLAAGVLTWLGSAAEHAGLGASTIVAAGVNTVPPALLVLGAGVLAFGAAPRATAAVAYGVLSWSLVVEVAGGFGTLGHWVLDTSVFHQMAAAPAVPVDWTSAGVMAAGGVAATIIGTVAFGRRDLRGE
jgi:ABC-2 type transport system permease protein